MRALTIFLMFAFAVNAVPAQSKKTWNLVKDFGARPDNKTDNYAAFLKAGETISAARGGTLIIPKGVYYIASYKINGGAKANSVRDIVFRNCNGLTILGNGSLVRMNGNFTRSPDYQLPGVPFNYAYNNTVAPFLFTNCKDVILKDIELDGGVRSMKKGGPVVEGENYGVRISDQEGDTSSRILLQNVNAHHFAADGFGISSNGERIALIGCRASNNARLGMSLVKGTAVTIERSFFDSTGFTGDYGWHAPGAGIDVENEFGAGKLKQVLIKNCHIRSNKGFQIVTTLSSDKILIDSCFIADLTYGYSDGLNGLGMYSQNSVISNSILFATIQIDIADYASYKGPSIVQVVNNIIYSGHRAITSSDFGRPVNFTGNIIVMLPKPQLDAYFPFIQNYNCTFNGNMVVYHPDRLKGGPGQVTGLVQSVAETSNNFWLLARNGMTDLDYQKNWYYPVMNGSKLVGKQFYSENHTHANKYGITLLLKKNETDQLLSKSLFKAYKQTMLNKKYLAEANEVRKYMRSMIAAK